MVVACTEYPFSSRDQGLLSRNWKLLSRNWELAAPTPGIHRFFFEVFHTYGDPRPTVAQVLLASAESP